MTIIALAAAGLVGLPLLVGLSLAAPAVAEIGALPSGLAGAEEVRIPSASGSLLQGWWVPVKHPGDGTVILLHGIRNNRLSMVRRARRLVAAGYGVLLFDFQAHGASPGRHITGGKLEALDVAAAIGLVRSREPSERIGLVGSSLGAAAALLGPGQVDVQALVLESLYTDVGASFGAWLGTILDPRSDAVMAPWLRAIFDDLLLPSIGVAAGDLRPIERIGTVTAPILLMTGSRDSIAPVSMARALYTRAGAPKQIWTIDAASHTDLEAFAPDRYWPIVLPFLEANLRRRGGIAVSAQ